MGEEKNGSFNHVSYDDQKSYFNDGTEEVTNTGTDTGTTNEGVSLENNTDLPEQQAGEKAESNKPVEEETETEKRNENENKDSESESNNTKTEEATNMEADTEASGESGLQQHVKNFHKKGATAARMENNNFVGPKKSYKGIKCGQATVIEGWEDWDSEDMGEEDTIDDEDLIQQLSTQSYQRRMEDVANEDKKTCGTENKNKGTEYKNKNNNIEQQDSLFGVGGRRNENQKGRTNIIKRSTMEAIDKEENGDINEESMEEGDKYDKDQEEDDDDNKKVDDEIIGATDVTGANDTEEENSDNEIDFI